MKSDETTIAIMGEDVPARHERMSIHELRFLPDNPRVYATIREMPDFAELTPEEKQVRIYERLLRESSVKKLEPEIKRDGGLQDPVTVRIDTCQVIEGNSRLAVYRKLWNETRDDQWADIRCLTVSKLTPDQQTRLLGQAHLRGRTEWSRYAKALFCFSWVEEQHKDISTLATLSGFTADAIRKNVKIIYLMEENKDDKLSHFSYYDVLVRNRIISGAIGENAALKATLFPQIKGEAFTSQQMRDHLQTVIPKRRILQKYVRGDVNLHDAYDRAKISGTEQRLKKVLYGLDDIEKGDIDGLERNEFGAVKQVVRKIRQQLKRVCGIIDAAEE